MLKTRLSVSGSTIVQKTAPSVGGQGIAATASKKTNVTADYGSFGSSPSSMLTMGGPQYSTMFQGIAPEYNEAALLNFYRDCYYYDNTAGSAVDLLSEFPFSDFTLSGVENKELAIYNESLARLNIRSFTKEVSHAYLVDGAFAGTLVYDPEARLFQDVMMHDIGFAQVSPQPFHSIDPVISVNASSKLSQFLNSGSPYLEAILQNYPKGVLDRYLNGQVALDPLTTLYVPRRGLQDRTHISFLKRILPMYMLEKVLFRGTLLEATKRQRATSLITAGSENWIPTDAELGGILAEFQRSELDPLGAWLITREGVNVQDIRQGGEFWKWTDVIDQMTPHKLRALGISEAFLSGDASYATAETAISVFMDTCESYRQFLTYKIFTSKLFPLIAALHGMYRDPRKAHRVNNVGDLMKNISNHNNLLIPTIQWHKSLTSRDADSQWDMLDKLSEKGFVIPLKMWAAAANVDIGSLVRDLEEDRKIRESIEQVTGHKAEAQGVHEDLDMGDEMGDPQLAGEAADQMQSEQSRAIARATGMDPGIRSTKNPRQSRSIPLLSREFGDPMIGRFSKSGTTIHSVVNERAKSKQVNDNIMRAVKALSDPNYRMTVRKKVAEKLGSSSIKVTR
jgi:hypothetical protein